MLRIVYLFLVFQLICFAKVYAQQDLIVANSYYEQRKYPKAIEFYLKALEKKSSTRALYRLANCYRLTHEYDKAEEYYEKAVNSPGTPSKVMYDYARVLMINEKYTLAKAVFKEYLKTDTGNVSAKRLRASCDSAYLWLKDSAYNIVRPLSHFNTKYDENNLQPYYEGYLLTSNRTDAEDLSDLRHLDPISWLPFFKIYYIEFDKNFEIITNELLESPWNNRYHSGPVSISSSMDTIWISRIDVDRRFENRFNTQNIVHYYKDEHDRWEEGRSVPFNNDFYETTHPFICPSGDTLFYASTKKSGVGKYDLYYSIKKGNTWSEPKNLGDEINTVESELSPFYDQKNHRLYFSSSGHIGFGGLDLFYSDLKNGEWQTPVNLKHPINTSLDELSFYLKRDGQSGYFASNRKGGLGGDDIYEVQFYSPPEKEEIIDEYRFKVYYYENLDDGEKGTLIDVFISLIPESDSLKLVESRIGGNYFFFHLKGNGDFLLKSSKSGYFTKRLNFNTSDFKPFETTTLEVGIDKIVINKSIVIKNIYYDYSKANLRPEALLELDKVILLLKDNPQIKVQLGSHSDSRGGDAYNLGLSQRRAESAVNYIVSNGIDQRRIIAKGFGETELLNHCDDGVQCSDEEHQENRRTEFRVVGIVPNTTISNEK